ncbi:MAG: hypothetical protein H6P98_3225, partial [Candidatus Aminicenantes bacterium]|nr:hypothetical protein [Candidatus Aminicenantes bacterium]
MRSQPTAQERKPNPYPRRLYLIFAGLALVSTIGLDYRTARRGEKAYFFPSRTVRTEAVITPVPLADALRRFLEASGVPSPWFEGLEPEDGSPRIVVRLPREDYASLERRLERELRNKRAAVKKEEGREEELASYSWRITGEKQEHLTLVFALLEPRKEVPPSP